MVPQVREGRARPVCTKCDAVFFLDPKVVAGVITEIDGKLLMVCRNTEPGLGKWTFPAGFVDRGEVVEAAAIREVNEETGLDVEVAGLIGVYSYPGDTNILIVFAGNVVGGKLTPGVDVQEAGLFYVESMPPLAFERDKDIIKEWQKCMGIYFH